MDLDSKHIALIGCGNMGGAILRAWLQKLPKSVEYTIVSNNPVQVEAFLSHPNVNWIEAGDALPKNPDYILVAVKPQLLEAALTPYREYPHAIYLSIAAGKQIETYESLLMSPKIIRLMPNTPAAVGQGITTAFTKSNLTKSEQSEVQELIESFGELCRLDQEKYFHAATAISGSGPAYVYLLVEALTEAGVKNGLRPDLSEKLARQTVIGSGAYLKATSERAKQLRIQVTSPGGTTEAALSILRDALPSLISQAIEKAAKRSEDLA